MPVHFVRVHKSSIPLPQIQRQANRLPDKIKARAKASELREGMTTAQILSVCGRKPQRTSDMITRDGKKLTVWVYGSTSLQLTDDKIIKIFGP
jgi:hypothetical protein